MTTLATIPYIPMNHVIQQAPLPVYSKLHKSLKVHQVPAASDNLCWLIEYVPGQVAVVDGPGSTEVLAYCQLYDLQLTHILNTHIHGDHIGINRSMARQGYLTEIKVYGYQGTADQIPGITHMIDDESTFYLGEIAVKVWLTEGHLNGHISYIIEDFLFSGDTLFSGGCGYLFDGPAQSMYESLQRLAMLDTDTYVCCAHEYTTDNLSYAMSIDATNQALRTHAQHVIEQRTLKASTLPSTIGIERKINPFLRTEDLNIQHALMDHYQMDLKQIQQKSAYERFALIRALKDKKLYRHSSLEQKLSSHLK